MYVTVCRALAAIVSAQAEYVRCSEEESVLCTLQGRRSAVAVALPGTERQLQSQAQHDKRVAKLQDRMAVLQVELGWREPLSEGSAEYQQGLSLLRDQQLRHLQQQVEREAAALGEITQMRRGMGESCQQTKNQEKKAQRRRSRIRQLIDTMWAWQQKDLPGSTVTQQLPEQWTEQAIKDLFCGNFPWQQTQGGAGQLPSLLVESFRDACAEVSLLRCVPCMLSCFVTDLIKQQLSCVASTVQCRQKVCRMHAWAMQHECMPARLYACHTYVVTCCLLLLLCAVAAFCCQCTVASAHA